MIIRQLRLKNFRNYDELTVDFDKKVNIFVGNNAQGKTNIIEGIYVLAITKSHRMYQDANLIKKDAEFCKIKGIIKRNEQKDDSELEILISNKGKKASINQNPARRISDYISYFNTIIFHPDDLEILKGSPGERRRFLNVEIGQLDNRYFAILNNYNILLKNRNEYLKKVTLDHYDASYLDILTDQLIDKAIKIYRYRQNFLADINRQMAIVNEQIKCFEKIEIKYETSIAIDEENEIRPLLLKKFKNSLQREIVMSQTMNGPHRDDFVFFANGKNIKDFGSQGQQRLMVLMLKLSEIEIFKEKKGEYPVLLLDDIFSELDLTKKHNIIKYLNKKMQIMITTTDIDDIDKKLLKRAKIFLVEDATVAECQNKL